MSGMLHLPYPDHHRMHMPYYVRVMYFLSDTISSQKKTMGLEPAITRLDEHLETHALSLEAQSSFITHK